MPRPRGFDIDEVLTNAMRVFWQKGYQGTSIQDLVVATGLKKGSLYAAFQDKRSLFDRSLRHYMEKADGGFKRSGVPLADLNEFFSKVVNASVDPSQPAVGCFIMNSAMEVDAKMVGLPVVDYIKSCLTKIEDYFYDLLVEAQELGHASKDLDPREQAKILLGAEFSIRGLSKVIRDKDYLESIAHGAMAPIWESSPHYRGGLSSGLGPVPKLGQTTTEQIQTN